VLALQLCVAIHFFRKNVRFPGSRCVAAICHSLVTTAAAAIAPAVLLSTSAGPPSLEGAAIVTVLSVIFWAAAIWVSRHPLRFELERLLALLHRRMPALVGGSRRADARETEASP
jgi:hypothetical protein